MDLLDITDATMASALTTVYGRLSEVVKDQAKLDPASRNLFRYLNGRQYMPNEEAENEDRNDLIVYVDHVVNVSAEATALEGVETGYGPTWESYIVDARDA